MLKSSMDSKYLELRAKANPALARLIKYTTSETDEFLRQVILLVLENNLGASDELPNSLYHQNRGYTSYDIANIATHLLGNHYSRGFRVGDAHHAWTRLNKILENLIEIDPLKAVALGMDLATLDISTDPSIEWRYRYLRGNGLAILASDKARPYLLEYLQDNPDDFYGLSFYLTRLIIDWDLDFSVAEIACSVPEFYSKVVAYKVALNLDSDPRPDITELAYKKLSMDYVRQQIEWYLEIEDTRELARSILQTSPET